MISQPRQRNYRKEPDENLRNENTTSEKNSLYGLNNRTVTREKN